MTPEEKIQKLEQKLERLEKVSFDAELGGNAPNELKTCFHNQKYVQHNEIDLRELWKVIWLGRFKIISITGFFLVASIIYALSLANVFRSEALLVSNSKESSGSGLSALAGQFGGLASLAGVNLNGGGTDKTTYALEVLKSREFLYNFIKDNQLKIPLMAADGWNRKTNNFTYDSSIYDIKNKSWVRKVNEPFKPEPSLQETYEEFLSENLSVSKDDKTGMVKISVEHYSPYLAKELVDKLIKAINLTIKQQDMAEAIKSISYLEDELKNTQLSGAQTVFYQLIEQQQQTLMLTKVRDDYVLKVVDTAVVAEDKVKPKRAVIVILVTLLGGILSMLTVLVTYYLKK